MTKERRDLTSVREGPRELLAMDEDARSSSPKPSTISIVTSILEQAITEVGGRAITYDAPDGEESMPTVVAMFNTLYGLELTAEQGWQFMSLVKMVRSSQGEYKRDNYVDQSAYSAFAGKAGADTDDEGSDPHG